MVLKTELSPQWSRPNGSIYKYHDLGKVAEFLPNLAYVGDRKK